MLKFLIGLTGTIACGKELVSSVFREDGFSYFSLSAAVREEAARRCIRDPTRKQLQDIGNELRELLGVDIWARRTFDKIMKSGAKYAVVDGIRNPLEVRYLREKSSFYLVAVDAPIELRFKRLIERHREGDPKTYEEFLAVDARDRGLGEDETGQQVGQCLNMADYWIFNQKSIEELKREVNRILEKLVPELTPLSS